MKIRRILWFALPIFTLFYHQSSAQVTDTFKLVNKQSILNGKAYFLFPASAVNSKRAVDIMSADPNANEETRIVLDVKKIRVVFFAQELYTLGGKDFFSKVSANNTSPYGFSRKILSDKDSVLSVLSTPTKFDETKKAILLNSLLVRTQDNTVFRIDAYINPEGFEHKSEFQKLSENIFKSLIKGQRLNKRSTRKEVYAIRGGKKSFVFNLPQGYGISIDDQYDFEVFKIHKYTDFGDTNWSNLTIYAGNYPSFFHSDYGFTESDAQTVPGKFLDSKIEWLKFRNEKNNIILKEQKVPSDNIENGLIIHIAISSDRESSVDELTNFVEAIKLTGD